MTKKGEVGTSLVPVLPRPEKRLYFIQYSEMRAASVGKDTSVIHVCLQIVIYPELIYIYCCPFADSFCSLVGSYQALYSGFASGHAIYK